MSTCNEFLSLPRHHFENPNGEDMRKWILNLVSKFNNDPTVNKSKIVFLQEHVLDLCGKRESYNTKGFYLRSDIFSYIPTVRIFVTELWTWWSNFTIIERLTILRYSFYWDRFECMREKERVLGGREGKTKLRGREIAKTTVSLKNDLACLYL